MSFSATRLTCYALLSSMEQDLRQLVLDVADSVEALPALTTERLERAHDRRRRDGHSYTVSLEGILPYLDFAEVYELVMSSKKMFAADRISTLLAIAPRIQKIIEIRNRVAHTRPMEIDDASHLIDSARELVGTHGSGWVDLTGTLRRLEENPSYVLGLTVSLPRDPDRGPQHNLPVPDFDETGFFGRKEQLRQIKKALLGPYPVISVLGDGGIGKTSIALKAAYELIDDPDPIFDAIVWVTAKATVLTPNEIQRIHGAIESSLGLFGRAAEELGAPPDSNPEGEILSYLENFRVLLILDNLETVLDERLRSFLLELPVGSKVLITSRIGVGSTEFPVHLSPLDLDDSVKLLRALSRVRGIQQLKSMDQESVSKLVASMNGHPAYIRWFVAGIQTGIRPEDLLGNNALLLEYCMSNVYEYLSEDAKAVVRSMQVLQGARNQAELAYLNDYSADSIQSALLELLTTNFVSMTNQNSLQSIDTVYQLSDFGKQYLDQHHSVAAEERHWLLSRKDGLRDLGPGLAADSISAPYDPNTVAVRGPGDYHVARLLREALINSDDVERSLALCLEAQKLAPTYHEGWRVEAYLRQLERNEFEATSAYERAIELANDSPEVHYHFGTFLLNETADAGRGLKVLQQAARLDSRSSVILGQIAWAHFQIGDFTAAMDAAAHVVQSVTEPTSVRQSALALHLRALTAGTGKLTNNHASDAAMEMLEVGLHVLESVDGLDLTPYALDQIVHLSHIAVQLGSISEGYTASKSIEYSTRLRNLAKASPHYDGARKIGQVSSMKIDSGYVFLRSGSTDYFCHVRDFSNSNDWTFIDSTSVCAFEPKPNPPKGDRATSVRLLD